jgi:hypothetical protein
LGTSGSGLKDNIVNVFGPKLMQHIMAIDLPDITYTTRKRAERKFGYHARTTTSRGFSGDDVKLTP